MSVTLIQQLRGSSLYSSTTNPTIDTGFESLAVFPQGSVVLFEFNLYIRTVNTGALSDWKLSSLGVQNFSLPYLEYEAIVTRTGVDMYTVSELSNTTGAVATWVDDTPSGYYLLEFDSPVLDLATTVVYISGKGIDTRYYAEVDNTTQISVTTVLYNSNTPSLIADSMNSININVRIY